MQRTTFTIEVPGREPTEHVFEGERALLGSGGHCEIRLPAECGADAEHLEIVVRGHRLWVSALAAAPEARIDGAAFQEAELKPNTVIELGRARLRARLDTGAKSETAEKKKSSQISPMTLILATVGLGAAGYLYLQDQGAGDGRNAPAPAVAPDLWSSVPGSCAESAGDGAYSLALEALRMAQAKEERRPFKTEAGVASVGDYRRAVACFSAAGETSLAAHFTQTAAGLEASVNNDYRAHRLKLDHALAIQDWGTAREEADVVLAFVSGQSGPYVAWLSELARRFELERGTPQ